MSRLSDYKNKDYSNNENLSNRENEEKINQEKLQEKYEQYKDMSQNDLNAELFKEVSRQKTNGTFDYNALSSMVENLRPSLTQEQYQNIKRILESLK